MSDINIRIGKKLQKIRESKNLSLNDVGLKVGKARNTIHAYEKGKISLKAVSAKRKNSSITKKLSA